MKTEELPQLCRDLEWFDRWKSNRTKMNLDNTVPDRLLEYLREYLHYRIATREES